MCIAAFFYIKASIWIVKILTFIANFTFFYSLPSPLLCFAALLIWFFIFTSTIAWKLIIQLFHKIFSAVRAQSEF